MATAARPDERRGPAAAEAASRSRQARAANRELVTGALV
jgi:hypothetical protein